MKEQPQKPKHWYALNEQYPTVSALGEEVAVYSCEEVDPYIQWQTERISHLESENTALKERVAELEKDQRAFRIMERMVKEWGNMTYEQQIEIHRIIFG